MRHISTHFFLFFSILFSTCTTHFQHIHIIENTPKNLMAPPESATETSITLLWDKPDQYANISGYDIFQDGVFVATSEKTNLTISKLQPNKSYDFFVKAKDAEGNLSAPSDTVKTSTKPKGRIFNVVDYGAKGDGVTMNTVSIQKAIDACSVGGTVYIPPGKFLSGALFLKSNMTFYISREGVLKGSIQTKDYYPLVHNRFEGWELTTFASLLNAGKIDRKGGYSVKNLTISGKGIIRGGGTILGNAMINERGMRGRGRLILLMNAQNVNIQGLTIEESPCWTIHYIYSTNVTLHDLNINSTAANGDGIDPDSSTDSYIFNCTFSTGDDCIAIKSGKNPEGYMIAKPTENVFISNCNFIKGHGISIGSEMSGGVRNVSVRDCKAGNLINGMQIKATKDRGGFVENVRVKDCDLLKITIFTVLDYNNDGEAAPVLPYFKELEFTNINMSHANTNDTVIIAQGFSDVKNYTSNVVFKDIILPENATIILNKCKNFLFHNVKTVSSVKPNFKISDCINIKY